LIKIRSDKNFGNLSDSSGEEKNGDEEKSGKKIREERVKRRKERGERRKERKKQKEKRNNGVLMEGRNKSKVRKKGRVGHLQRKEAKHATYKSRRHNLQE
jgi:hypothetical protein